MYCCACWDGGTRDAQNQMGSDEGFREAASFPTGEFYVHGDVVFYELFYDGMVAFECK